MKLSLRTPTAVVLRDSGAFGYVAGTLVALGGALIVLYAMASPGPAWTRVVPVPVGVLLAAIGGWAVRRTAVTSYVFDREQRALVIERKRLGGAVTSERYPLRDIADVVLEESRHTRATPTWRVAIRLADGRTIPCTFYYSSPREPKAAMVNAVRELLSRADGRERAPVTTREIAATSAPPSPRELRATRTAVRLITVCCSIFMVVGAWLGLEQWVRLSRWVPVPATVTGSTVERHSGSRGDPTYSPRITYRYTVSGREYAADRATPLGESRGGGWAYGIAARYAPGQRTTAWYDPSSPGQAYLLHEWSVLPYIFIVFPLGFIALFRWAARKGVLRPRRRA